jgi:5-(carboxyamino)imidazole ribonucleotide synthase
VATLGIIGGGQLARMLVLQAAELGIACRVLDPNPDAGAGRLCPQLIADYDDTEALRELAAACDVLTYDFENVPADALRTLDLGDRLRPGVDVLGTAQDRLHEKTLFRELGLDVGDFHAVGSRTDLLDALDRTGYPAVLKTRRLGYDGKGQAVLREPEDLERAWHRLGDEALILEAFVDFDRECSVIGVRASSGEVRCYPLTENHHVHGILHTSRAPVPDLDPLQARAEAWIAALMAHFDYVGVMALELFVCDGRLLANEIAPRVHNSGHWTIDGADCSQFENHLRACLDLPLGPVSASGESLMINFIGELPGVDALLGVPGLHWHDYAKQPRPGRKVGHATLCARDADSFAARLAALRTAAPDLLD